MSKFANPIQQRSAESRRKPLENSMSFCSQCGKLISADGKFCPNCGAALNPIRREDEDSRTTRTMPPAHVLEYAPFWPRLWAGVLDVAIIGGVQVALGIAVGLFMLGFGEMLVVQFICVVGTWLYHANLESSARQSTWGKRMMGLVVTDLKGDRISFACATGRFVGKILSGCILGLGFLLVIFTEKRQALHDFMSDTVVIRKPTHVGSCIHRESLPDNHFSGRDVAVCILIVLMMFFVLGPFGLPFVYKSRRFNKTAKILLTLVMIPYTWFLGAIFVRAFHGVRP